MQCKGYCKFGFICGPQFGIFFRYITVQHSGLVWCVLVCDTLASLISFAFEMSGTKKIQKPSGSDIVFLWAAWVCIRIFIYNSFGLRLGVRWCETLWLSNVIKHRPNTSKNYPKKMVASWHRWAKLMQKQTPIPSVEINLIHVEHA